jgi:hypothetical protein
VSLHRCQLEQAIRYVLSSMHVLSVLSWHPNRSAR